MARGIKIRQANTTADIGTIQEGEAVFCFEDSKIYGTPNGVIQQTIGGAEAQIQSVMTKNTYNVTTGQTVGRTYEAKGYIAVLEPANKAVRNKRTGQEGAFVALDKGDEWEFVSDFDGALVVIETEQRYAFQPDQKEWGHFGLSVYQTANLAIGNHIEYDQCIAGNIVVSQGEGQSKGIFHLKQGRTYRLTAYIHCEGQGPTFAWKNITDNVLIGGITQSWETSHNTVVGVVTTDKDINVVVSIEWHQGNLPTIYGGENGKYSSVFIEEIGVTGTLIDEYHFHHVGDVKWYTADKPPTGWLECNGAELERTVYKKLFDVISTTFGEGDGSTTFNVPDLRGEFVRGWDNNRGIDQGRNFGVTQEDLFKSHTHTPTWGSCMVAWKGSDGNGSMSQGKDYYGSGLSSVGGVETRPRNISLLPCIKY